MKQTDTRTCSDPHRKGCETKLSRYNGSDRCFACQPPSMVAIRHAALLPEQNRGVRLA